MLINPSDFHQYIIDFLSHVWLLFVPSAVNTRRIKAGVSRFFAVLRHIREERRKFIQDGNETGLKNQE